MLQILRRGQKWILAVAIVLVGGAFVVFVPGTGDLMGAPAQTAVVAGDREFDFRDLDRVRQRQIEEYRRTLGDAFDAVAASDTLDQLAANQLAQMAILAQEAERLGLRVGDRELRDFMRSVPGGVGTDGRIDREAWTQHAEREFGSVTRFQAALTDELLARKTLRLISASTALSDAEVRDRLRYGLEEVDVAYVAIDPQQHAGDAEIDDAAVEALLATDLPRVQRAYDDRKSEFDQPEQVHARHLLVRIVAEEGGDPEKARAAALEKARQAAARIEKGERFEDVAKQLSEDVGSKESGGDLGFFPRGRMVPAFEEVAFALEPGKLSEPVESPYGFHVIRVEERRPAKLVAFDEAKPALAREILRGERAAQAAETLVEKLRAAIAQGRTLVEAARERNLTLERPAPLRRRPDGVIPGLGTSKEALAAVFSLTPENPTSDRVFEIAGKRVLFERTGGRRPTDAELETRVATAREQMLEQRRNELSAAWVEARRTQLEQDGELVYSLRPKGTAE